MKTNLNNIYSEPSKGIIYSPFKLDVEPMEHLILVNIENDPDKYYKIFELQQARDENDNKRLLVIAYPNSGPVDIYHQSAYPFSQRTNVLGSANLIERPMENAKFEVASDKIDIYFSFKDRFGRYIEVIVLEIRRKKKKPFSLLAPVGGSSDNPPSLPVYMLYEMSFTRRSYTDIKVMIDEVIHKPDTFPLPMDWSRNYFTRYSVDTFIVDWNKNYNGLLSSLKPNKNCIIEDKGARYELINNSGHYEIKQMSVKNGKHQLKIDFLPAVPDIICLKDNIQMDGKFVISSEKTIGTIDGVYRIQRKQEVIEISIHPSGGWKPNEKNWLLKMFYLLAPSFKKWPSTFIWKAKIEITDRGAPMIESSWEREENWKETLQSGVFTLFDD